MSQGAMAALSQLANHIEALEIKLDTVFDLLRKVLDEVQQYDWDSATESTDRGSDGEEHLSDYE